MDATQVLRLGWLIEAVFQTKADLHFNARHVFEAKEQAFGVNITPCNDLVVMSPVIAREDLPRRYSFPKCAVITRGQPVFHVLNVFKNRHGPSLTDHAPSAQI